MAVYSDIRYGNSGAIGSDFGEALLQTLTASSSSSLSFTTGIDSTFKIYRFRFINIHPSDNATRLKYNFSTDGGSNYNVAKTTISYQAYHQENDGNAGTNYETGTDLAQGTGNQMVLVETGNDNDQSACGFLHLFNPSSTTFVKHFISESNSYEATNNNQHSFIAGYGNTTNAVNAIQFSMQSGNIDSGDILLFGLN